MNIAMTGATGYIGKHLSSYLTEKGGHRVIPLGRSMFREGMSGLLIQTLAHCDVVINLAGAPINKRWTPEYKQELFNSRIVVTHRIVRALNAVKTKPKLMISASAVGYYPPEVAYCCIRPSDCGLRAFFTKKFAGFQVRRPVKRQSAQMNEKWEPKNRNFVENAKT